MSSNQLEAATCAALSHVLSASCCLENLWLDKNPLGKQVSSTAAALVPQTKRKVMRGPG